MAKRGTSVFRNPVDKEATTVATLPDLTAYQAKWGTEGRPSPRTGTTGAGIQKFGTQQLKYLDPAKPALGVIEIDTGATTRFGWQEFVGDPTPNQTTPFSQTYQQKRPATITTYEQLETSPHAPTPSEPINLGDIFGIGNGNDIDKHGCECDACKNGTGQCSDKRGECDAWDVACELFGKDTIDKHGCECEACKNGTGQCSDKCGKCNAWDLMCEAGCATEAIAGDECGFWDVGCKVGSWWDKYGIIVMIIGGLIGLGIVLWLLRPLFSMIGAFKGGSP